VLPTEPRYLRRRATTNAHDQHRHDTRAALIGAAMALLAAFATLAAAVLPLILVGRSLFSGAEILVAFAILGVVLVVFYAFVFQRLLRLKAEKNGTGSIDIDIGGPT
jgi:Na+/proline symporter